MPLFVSNGEKGVPVQQCSYLVIGAGVGGAIARHLFEQPDTSWVSIADRDIEAARAVARKNASSVIFLDTEALSGRSLCSIIERHDVVISAIPARFSPKIIRCAIETGTSFCDLGGVVSVSRHLQRLENQARAARISIVTDCGLMPGLGNIVADSLLDSLDMTSDVSVVIRAGGLPLRPRGRLNYGRMFSPEGLHHLCHDQAPVVIDGSIKYVPPFTGYRHVNVPELLELNPKFTHVESFVTAGAGLAPWSFQKRGVRHFEEHTLRWPGFVRGISSAKDIAALEKCLDPISAEYPDLMYLDVVAQERQGRKRSESYQLLDFFDPATELTAMARTTGFPTAILARMLAQKSLAPGVWTPEAALRAAGLTHEYLRKVTAAL